MNLNLDPEASRRSAIRYLCASCAVGLAPRAGGEESNGAAKFPIGICDWNLNQRQNIGAFDVAEEIGLEGLQVSFSNPGSEYDLRDPKVREQYYRRIDETGIRLASLGMGILNQNALATHPEAIGWVGDAIDTMAAMHREQPDKATNICLLAFFGNGDINGKPELMDAVIEKLKTVSGRAEDSGVILGIESYLSADDHLKIIDGVGSSAIQVYYDSANSLAKGYDIYEEVVQIGAERICQVHCKERNQLIGDGDVDFKKFHRALVKAGYRDWLVLEASKPREMKLVEAYQRNHQRLNAIFNP